MRTVSVVRGRPRPADRAMARPKKYRKRAREAARQPEGVVPQRRIDMRFCTIEVLDDGRLRPRSLGNGLESRAAELSAGGIVTGTAYVNRLESPFDLLHRNGGLRDPRDPDAEARRYAAGNAIREIYEEARTMPVQSTGYDKMMALVGSGGPQDKSDHAHDQEQRFKRIMAALGPFATVVNRVAKGEDVEPRLCEALRRGLDRVADQLWHGPPRTFRRRRIVGGPVDGPEER